MKAPEIVALFQARQTVAEIVRTTGVGERVCLSGFAGDRSRFTNASTNSRASLRQRDELLLVAEDRIEATVLPVGLGRFYPLFR
jgi:hypothetical protein